MRKIVFIVIVILSVCAFSAAAEGPGGLDAFGIYGHLGGLTSGTGSTGTNIGLSLMYLPFPVIGLEYSVQSEALNLAMSFDYWVLHESLGGPIMYHVAVGLYGGMILGDPAVFDLGLRIPVAGLELWPVKPLEIYIDVIPIIPLLPSPGFDLGADIGLRVHF